MRLFLSHRIITTFASGNSVVSFRYSFSPRNLLLQVAFIERESQYGSCSLSRFVERGGRRKMFERFNVVPSARVLPVQNSQGMVSCRGSVPRKKRIRATTRDAGYCRRPKVQLHDSKQNSALRILNSSLNPKLPDFLRQSFNTILILLHQVIYLMHRAVNLRAAERGV